MAKTLKKAYVADEIEINPYTIGLLDQSVLIGRPIPQKQTLNPPRYKSVSRAIGKIYRRQNRGIFWRIGIERVK